jgi:hypothetical protein
VRVVFNLDLPWLTLASTLADCEEDGRIHYVKFLERYQITLQDADTSWMDAIVERTCERLFSACPDLEGAYSFFDTDGSGSIDLEEFERGLSKVDLGLSRAQIVDLMNSIDQDKDGRIELDEFVARFKVVFSRVEDGMCSCPLLPRGVPFHTYCVQAPRQAPMPLRQLTRGHGAR